MIYFFDTDMCIYYLVGKYPRLFSKLLSNKPDNIKIPAIVKTELIYSAEKSIKREDNLSKVSSFLLPYEIVPFDSTGADYYGKIRMKLEKNGTLIGPNDLLIAAIVMTKNAVLVTNNTREFSRVEGLQIENWTI